KHHCAIPDHTPPCLRHSCPTRRSSDLSDDAERGDIDLVAARSTGVGPYVALDLDGCFLAEVAGHVERPVADGGPRHDALDEPGAVADLQEVNLPARAAVGEPAAQRHAPAVVSGDFFDAGHGTLSGRVRLLRTETARPAHRVSPESALAPRRPRRASWPRRRVTAARRPAGPRSRS